MKENSLKIIYIVGLILSSLIMLIIMIFGAVSLNITSLMFFYAIKFLSGFGLLISIATGFLILIDNASEKLTKKGTLVVIIIEIVIPFVLIGYAIYQIVSSYFSETLFSQQGFWLVVEVIVYMYGIISLFVNLYIIPLIKDTFYKGIELSKLIGIKKRAKSAARKVKKKYFVLKKDYAQIHKQDQLTVKDLLNSWRIKFAVNFLIIIAIGSIIFTPISFICIIYWLRLYVIFRAERKDFERYSLLITILFIVVIAIIAPFLNLAFYSSIAQYYWTINIFYLIGISLASYIFIKRLLSLRGITIQDYKMKKKDKKIKQLEKEREELENKLKNHD